MFLGIKIRKAVFNQCEQNKSTLLRGTLIHSWILSARLAGVGAAGAQGRPGTPTVSLTETSQHGAVEQHHLCAPGRLRAAGRPFLASPPRASLRLLPVSVSSIFRSLCSAATPSSRTDPHPHSVHPTQTTLLKKRQNI